MSARPADRSRKYEARRHGDLVRRDAGDGRRAQPADLIRVATELQDPAIVLEVGRAAGCGVLPYIVGFTPKTMKDMSMNKDQFQGDARNIGGKVEKAVGDAVNSRDWQVDGVVDQVAGNAQSLYGRAKSAIGDIVDGAPELADRLGSEARDAGDRAADAARRGTRTAQSAAKDEPLLWVLGAAAVGYGLAWLVHGKRD